MTRRGGPTAQYQAYIHSPEWEFKRLETFNIQGRKCAKCGATCSLHVHHHTYERFGNEDPTDLVVLCIPCHRLVHQVHDSYKGPGKPSLTDTTFAVLEGRLPETGPEYGKTVRMTAKGRANVARRRAAKRKRISAL